MFDQTENYASFSSKFVWKLSSVWLNIFPYFLHKRVLTPFSFIPTWRFIITIMNRYFFDCWTLIFIGDLFFMRAFRINSVFRFFLKCHICAITNWMSVWKSIGTIGIVKSTMQTKIVDFVEFFFGLHKFE